VGKATNSTASVSYWDFEHADYTAINTYLNSIDWNDMFSSSITVEGCWNSIWSPYFISKQMTKGDLRH